jgi:hypothetical protein
MFANLEDFALRMWGRLQPAADFSPPHVAGKSLPTDERTAASGIVFSGLLYEPLYGAVGIRDKVTDVAEPSSTFTFVPRDGIRLNIAADSDIPFI